MRFETDGQIVQTRFVPKAEHVGFRQIVHGGLLATLLDEIMVWACAVKTNRFAFCAELNVRFMHPVHPGEEVVATAELASNRRDKVFEVKGELRNASGLALVRSTGKYLPIGEAEAREMATDFVGDARRFSISAHFTSKRIFSRSRVVPSSRLSWASVLL